MAHTIATSCEERSPKGMRKVSYLALPQFSKSIFFFFFSTYFQAPSYSLNRMLAAFLFPLWVPSLSSLQPPSFHYVCSFVCTCVWVCLCARPGKYIHTKWDWGMVTAQREQAITKKRSRKASSRGVFWVINFAARRLCISHGLHKCRILIQQRCPDNRLSFFFLSPGAAGGSWHFGCFLLSQGRITFISTGSLHAWAYVCIFLFYFSICHPRISFSIYDIFLYRVNMRQWT